MKRVRWLGLVSSLSLGLACRAAPEHGLERPEPSSSDLAARARALAQRVLVVDGHVDLPYRLYAERAARGEIRSWDFETGTSSVGDFDFPRARAGGLDAPFMSVYVPAEHQATPGKSRAVADALIDLVEQIAARAPDRFAIARTPAEVLENQRAGRVSLPMGIENGSAFEDDLELIPHFHRRGVRYATLTHAKDNRICDSSYDETGTWKGLSPFGREVIRVMNEVGMMVDVSHVSDAAFRQAVALSRAPVIASHSSLRHFTPGFERNVSDELLRALAEKGGVLMVNFGSTFVKESSRQQGERIWRALRGFMEAERLSPADPRVRAQAAKLKAQQPFVRASVEDVADHVERAIQIAGMEHVGLGSDFDGVGDTLPEGLEDVSKLPRLFEALLARGLSEAELEQLASGNILRVWSRVEALARPERERP